MTSSDVSLIERLRKENLDQFFTLVRMHLSFVVDINTDDVDCSTDKPKQFRWNFHKKTKNPTTNSSQSNVSSAKNNTEVNSITEDGILRLNELIDFLSKPDNVTQEGIFRRTGSLSRQQELRQLLITGSSLGLDEGKFSVHDCASVLKGFLADLPQPLLMDQYYQTYCTLAAQYPPNVESSESKLLTALQLLLLLLAPPHRSFLKRLLTLLRLVADNETSNRMSPDTLATMFTPHLLCPRKLSPECFRTESVAASPVVSFMIRRAARLFEPPPRLATDAAAYFALRERRRAMSPHADLDESISDKTAASTVYTFVDRGRTRAENAANPTDAALAQLYAHIQALPDSHHKRRLVKHFNRQNGYGTPIQIHRTGKVAGSRSFGDSIKRHIFNKGLLNKTPKKGSASTINTIEEKNGKGKLQVDVSHKNIVLKNMAKQIANSESIEDNDDCDSDGSSESTLSDGALNQSRKLSPKFVSEPNLSRALDVDGDTPKNSKKRTTRLFRSKLVSASRNANKKYQKRGGNLPTCVPCAVEQDTVSDEDVSYPDTSAATPRRDGEGLGLRAHYLTSTPGLAEACSTPYAANFRRASMSPITKSTQKLSKAMQESIMTPRSRKPLIVTSEQRDSLPPAGSARSPGTDAGAGAEAEAEAGADSVFHSMSISPHNDSDFVSSDDEMMSRSTFLCERSAQSTSGSIHKNRTPYDGRSPSAADASPLRSESTRFIIGHERPGLDVHLDDDVDTDVNVVVPKFMTSHEMTDLFEQKPRSLSEPFRDYLLSRSVLTATPVDLSMLNCTNDHEDRLTDSLLYCLDGNLPSDLVSDGRTSGNRSPLKSINGKVEYGNCPDGNLPSDLVSEGRTSGNRSPLKSINGQVEYGNSPNRKRCLDTMTSDAESALKRIVVGKENGDYGTPIRETDL